MTVGDEEWKERVRAYNRRQRMLRGVCECGAYYPEEHTARREGVIEGLQQAWEIADEIYAGHVEHPHDLTLVLGTIRAEIERLRRGE